MIEVFDQIEQGTEEWLRLRAGRATASVFKDILAKGEGKTRRKLLLTLAGERLTGEPAESYSNGFMERGKEQEATARAMYAAFYAESVPCQVGFILNGENGYSPDSLVGDDGLLEVKTTKADIQLDILLRDRVPPEHTAQLQGGLWVSERAWIDVVIYSPRLPLFVKRIGRDPDYIANLATEVAAFNAELAETVERIRSMDQREAA